MSSISTIITESITPFVNGEGHLLITKKSNNGVEKLLYKIYPKERRKELIEANWEDPNLSPKIHVLVQFREYKDDVKTWG